MAKPKVPGAGPTADEQPRQQPTNAPAIKVRAIREGYYEHLRRFPGDIFEIRGDRYPADVVRPIGAADGRGTIPFTLHKAGEVIEFSETWMELVTDQSLPLNQRTAQQMLTEEHDNLLRDRIGTSTGNQNPLG
jgi:hypothetical protein